MSEEKEAEVVRTLKENSHDHRHRHTEGRTKKRTLIARIKRSMEHNRDDEESTFQRFYSMSIIRGVVALIVCVVLYGVAYFLINNVHIYDVTYIEPTCMGGGHSVHTCLFCGSSYSDPDTGSKGHTEGDWVVINEPTETDCGSRTLLCADCNTILKSEYVDALADLPKVYIDGYVGNLSEEKDYYVSTVFSDGNQTPSYATIRLDRIASFKDKEGYFIRLYSDAEAKTPFTAPIFGLSSDYGVILSPDLNDNTHIRKILSSRLWSDIVTERDGTEFCAGDGVPVMLYINGGYEGVYTMRIPCDSKSMGLNSNKTAIVRAVENNFNTSFKKLADFDGRDFCITERSFDESSVKLSFNSLISFVINNTGASFANGISQYLDVDKTIDYMLFMYFSATFDYNTSDIIWTTDDCSRWYPVNSDFTVGWGLTPVDTEMTAKECFYPYTRSNGDLSSSTAMLLWIRLLVCFPEKVDYRYAMLRRGALSDENLEKRVEEIACVPDSLTDSAESVSRIRKFVEERAVMLDKVFAEE